MTHEVVAALAGAAVGVIGGFLAAYATNAIADYRRDAAVRKQILALMRVVEARMLVVALHRGVPLEAWVSLDLLVSAFSQPTAPRRSAEIGMRSFLPRLPNYSHFNILTESHEKPGSTESTRFLTLPVCIA